MLKKGPLILWPLLESLQVEGIGDVRISQGVKHIPVQAIENAEQVGATPLQRPVQAVAVPGCADLPGVGRADCGYEIGVLEGLADLIA